MIGIALNNNEMKCQLNVNVIVVGEKQRGWNKKRWINKSSKNWIWDKVRIKQTKKDLMEIVAMRDIV